MQRFRAERYRGTRVRFSATLDAKNIVGWAGVWMRVDGPDKQTISFDNMQNRSIQGTQACAKASVVLDVPLEAQDIALGLVLHGGGRAELGNMLLETVELTVPTTNLAPPPEIKILPDGGHTGPLTSPPLPPPPPLATDRKGDPRSDDKLGRIGVVWFSDRIITQDARGVSIRPGSGVLHLTGPDTWSDNAGDYTATRRGDTIVIKGLDATVGALSTMNGEFQMHREGDANVIDGTWGKPAKQFPVHIRVSRTKLDMTWGFYERHMLAEPSPQAPPACVYYSKRTGGIAVSASDALQVCGVIFDADAPPIQTVMAFLMTGFHRFDDGQ